MKQQTIIKTFLYGSFALALTTGLVLGSCSATLNNEKAPEPVDYVNPYMGNISHILVPTYPTIHLPNSMLRVYPERKDYTGDRIKGLPIIVTSHRGSSAFNLSFCQGDKITPKPVISYGYDNEIIKPYYYSADLADPETQVRYAPSHQSGVYELNFRKKGPVHLIINSKNGELTTDGNAISGYQQIKNFPTRVYLYMETNLTPVSCSVLKDSVFTSGNTASGKNAAIALSFEDNTSNIKIRYGISFINEEQAKSNLNREIFDYDLDKISDEGRKIWNQTLSKITVDGDNYDEKVVFYTSLYRTYERMICLSEDGRYYSAFDGKIHDDNGKPFYTDDWIWDTYRATHPLRVIIEPEMETDMINSFIRMAEQMDDFWMPTFPEVTGDSRRMNSNHGVATVIDSYSKGLKGIDLAKALFVAGSSVKVFEKDGTGKLDALKKKNFKVLHDYKKLASSMKADKIALICDDTNAKFISEGRDPNYLKETTDQAIKFLSNKSNKGFFLMVEGAQIDWASHNNAIENVVREVLDFDKAVEEALRFADKNGETLVIITADHETGGMALREGNIEKGKIKARFATGGHSPIMVPVYAYGPQAQNFRGVQDNTEIFAKILSALQVK